MKLFTAHGKLYSWRMDFPYLSDAKRRASPAERLRGEAVILSASIDVDGPRHFSRRIEQLGMRALANPLSYRGWRLQDQKTKDHIWPVKGDDGTEGFHKIMVASMKVPEPRYALAAEIIASRLAAFLRKPVPPSFIIDQGEGPDGRYSLVSVKPYPAAKSLVEAKPLTLPQQKNFFRVLSELYPLIFLLQLQDINPGAFVVDDNGHGAGALLDWEESGPAIWLQPGSNIPRRSFYEHSRKDTIRAFAEMKRRYCPDLSLPEQEVLSLELVRNNITQIENLPVNNIYDIIATLPENILNPREKKVLFDACLLHRKMLREAITQEFTFWQHDELIREPPARLVPAHVSAGLFDGNSAKIEAYLKTVEGFRNLAKNIAWNIDTGKYAEAFKLFQAAQQELCVRQQDPDKLHTLHDELTKHNIMLLPYLWDEQEKVTGLALVVPDAGTQAQMRYIESQYRLVTVTENEEGQLEVRHELHDEELMLRKALETTFRARPHRHISNNWRFDKPRQEQVPEVQAAMRPFLRGALEYPAMAACA